eukprot:6241615-Amphidinium_carterae.1
MEALLRATGDVRGGGVKRWAQEQLRAYLHAGCQVFATPSSVCLCPDGARFGNPGEEVLVSPAVHLSCKTTMWLPPQ